MGDGAAQRPVSKYIALLTLRCRIEGVKILPAGCLAQRGQGEVGPQAVQHAHDLLSPVRAGQETGNLLHPARIRSLTACMSYEVLPEPRVCPPPSDGDRRPGGDAASDAGEGLLRGAMDQDGKYILRELKYA